MSIPNRKDWKDGFCLKYAIIWFAGGSSAIDECELELQHRFPGSVFRNQEICWDTGSGNHGKGDIALRRLLGSPENLRRRHISRLVAKTIATIQGFQEGMCSILSGYRPVERVM